MKMNEIIKGLMKDRKKTQKQICREVGYAQSTLSTALGDDPNSLIWRLKILESLGYEVVVREKKMGRPAAGEYIVTIEDKKK